jgi:hypothetical protein
MPQKSDENPCGAVRLFMVTKARAPGLLWVSDPPPVECPRTEQDAVPRRLADTRTDTEKMAADTKAVLAPKLRAPRFAFDLKHHVGGHQAIHPQGFQ